MNTMLLSQEINKNRASFLDPESLPIQVNLNQLCDKHLRRITHLHALIAKEEEKLLAFMQFMSLNKDDISVS